MGEERRKYYRYPAISGSETVVVRHAGVERPARLVNLSADGFRLDMDEESIVEVGDIVLMATSSGFHRVRVVNVARDKGTLQLGLQRLQDLPASALESHADGERRPRRKRRLKDSVSGPLLQFAIPIAVGAMILGAAAWAWTTDSDPVGVIVDDRAFVTPTSDYTARRRRQAPEVEERTASNVKAKRQGPRVAAEGASGSSRWTSAVPRSAATEAMSPRSDRSDESNELSYGKSSPGEPFGQAAPLFDPQADATFSIKAALSTANRENKHVLVEFGARACDSCSRLNAAFTQDAEIAATFQKAFVLVLVDIEANQKLVARYVQDDLRERAPFLALLNKEGKVLQRRRTDELEVGSKVDVGKVKEILQQWASAG